MLKKFEVKGFKNFKNNILFDFSNVHDYKFNEKCIKEGLLNKAIIYGKNGVGKTNLGFAIFDITSHLADKNVTPGVYDYYLNADNDIDVAEFHYVFKLKTGEVDYVYRKSDLKKLLYEQVVLNGQLIFNYDYINKIGDLSALKNIAPNLNFEFNDDNISFVKYIVNNTLALNAAPLKEMVRFVNNMLWFRNLEDNRYIGYKTDSSDFIKFIFEKNNIEVFQELLHKAGVNEDLIKITDPDGQERLYFNRVSPLPFLKTASNGTKALYVLYYWLTTATDVTFLFIDEFDAYYHYELSEMIIQILESHFEFQTVLTSHNTNLLTNRIMRPDCYFILTSDKLTSLVNATDRELREGHNLEKLYINGEFDE